MRERESAIRSQKERGGGGGYKSAVSSSLDGGTDLVYPLSWNAWQGNAYRLSPRGCGLILSSLMSGAQESYPSFPFLA